MLKGGFASPDRCAAAAASPPPLLAPSPSAPTLENPALFSDYIVKLDAATLYSGKRRRGARGDRPKAPRTATGGAARARNRYRGVDALDLDVPACRLETTERVHFRGPTFGWTTAEWIDRRDASNVGEGYRARRRASDGGGRAGTRVVFAGPSTRIGAYARDGPERDRGWTPASPARDIPVTGWHLVVAVGQDEDCVAAGGGNDRVPRRRPRVAAAPHGRRRRLSKNRRFSKNQKERADVRVRLGKSNIKSGPGEARGGAGPELQLRALG
jgi:hypothetical protein